MPRTQVHWHASRSTDYQVRHVAHEAHHLETAGNICNLTAKYVHLLARILMQVLCRKFAKEGDRDLLRTSGGLAHTFHNSEDLIKYLAFEPFKGIGNPVDN